MEKKYKKILEITFINKYKTHAYVCEDGEIYIQLIVGRMFNEKEFTENKNSIFCHQTTKEHETTLFLFKELNEYYNINYGIFS